HAVVARVVLRELAGRVQDLQPGLQGGGVHGVDGGPVGGAERHVRLVVRGPGRRAEPEGGLAVRPGHAHHGPGEAHRLAHAERREQAQVRRGGGVDVNGLEPELWVGGFRALLLQSLHPRVMRGTYQNSALFDPAKAWSRFQRTVEFVGVRTFGSTAEVERAGARLRRLHAALRGYDPDTGYTFRIDHPDHLLWVHATEVDSYAQVARRAGLLDDDGVDAYLAESVRAARVIGLAEAPSSAGAMREYLASVRPELKLTD